MNIYARETIEICASILEVKLVLHPKVIQLMDTAVTFEGAYPFPGEWKKAFGRNLTCFDGLSIIIQAALTWVLVFCHGCECRYDCGCSCGCGGR